MLRCSRGAGRRARRGSSAAVCAGRAVRRLGRVGVLGPEDDQPRLAARRAPRRWTAGRRGRWRSRRAGSPRRSRSRRRISSSTSSSVEAGAARSCGQPGDRRLDRVPVALAVDVEVGRLVGQPAQRVAEGRRRLAGLDAAELDRAVVDARGWPSAASAPSRGRSCGPRGGWPSSGRGWGSRGRAAAAARSGRRRRSR